MISRVSHDYHQGAFNALKFLCEWLEQHKVALNGFLGCRSLPATEKDRFVMFDTAVKVLKTKPFIRKKDNAKFQMLIGAIIDDLDTFLAYGESTHIRAYRDEKKEVIKMEVEK